MGKCAALAPTALVVRPGTMAEGLEWMTCFHHQPRDESLMSNAFQTYFKGGIMNSCAVIIWTKGRIMKHPS